MINSCKDILSMEALDMVFFLKNELERLWKISFRIVSNMNDSPYAYRCFKTLCDIYTKIQNTDYELHVFRRDYDGFIGIVPVFDTASGLFTLDDLYDDGILPLIDYNDYIFSLSDYTRLDFKKDASHLFKSQSTKVLFG